MQFRFDAEEKRELHNSRAHLHKDCCITVPFLNILCCYLKRTHIHLESAEKG